MEVYCLWKFTVCGSLLFVEVYCLWKFTVCGSLLFVEVYCFRTNTFFISI